MAHKLNKYIPYIKANMNINVNFEYQQIEKALSLAICNIIKLICLSGIEYAAADVVEATRLRQ